MQNKIDKIINSLHALSNDIHNSDDDYSTRILHQYNRKMVGIKLLKRAHLILNTSNNSDIKQLVADILTYLKKEL